MTERDKRFLNRLSVVNDGPLSAADVIGSQDQPRRLTELLLAQLVLGVGSG